MTAIWIPESVLQLNLATNQLLYVMRMPQELVSFKFRGLINIWNEDCFISDLLLKGENKAQCYLAAYTTSVWLLTDLQVTYRNTDTLDRHSEKWQTHSLLHIFASWSFMFSYTITQQQFLMYSENACGILVAAASQFLSRWTKQKYLNKSKLIRITLFSFQTHIKELKCCKICQAVFTNPLISWERACNENYIRIITASIFFFNTRRTSIDFMLHIH